MDGEICEAFGLVRYDGDVHQHHLEDIVDSRNFSSMGLFSFLGIRGQGSKVFALFVSASHILSRLRTQSNHSGNSVSTFCWITTVPSWEAFIAGCGTDCRRKPNFSKFTDAYLIMTSRSLHPVLSLSAHYWWAWACVIWCSSASQELLFEAFKGLN